MGSFRSAAHSPACRLAATIPLNESLPSGTPKPPPLIVPAAIIVNFADCTTARALSPVLQPAVEAADSSFSSISVGSSCLNANAPVELGPNGEIPAAIPPPRASSPTNSLVVVADKMVPIRESAALPLTHSLFVVAEGVPK